MHTNIQRPIRFCYRIFLSHLILFRFPGLSHAFIWTPGPELSPTSLDSDLLTWLRDRLTNASLPFMNPAKRRDCGQLQTDCESGISLDPTMVRLSFFSLIVL
jgi:hypothetical protein